MIVPFSAAPVCYVAQRIDELLSCEERTPDDLSKALHDGFIEKFPSEGDLSAIVAQVLAEREKALKALSAYPSAITPSRVIDFGELIRQVLADNPLLSDGNAPIEDAAHAEEMRQCRVRFCDTVCRIARYVKGIDLSPEPLELEVATIQRSILPHDPSEFFHPLQNFPTQTMYYLLAVYPFDFNSAKVLEPQLYNICQNLYASFEKASASDYLFVLSREAVRMLHIPLKSQCEALLPYSDAVDSLLKTFIARSDTLFKAIQCLDDYLYLAQHLEVAATPEDLMEQIAKQHLMTDPTRFPFNDPQFLFDLLPLAKKIPPNEQMMRDLIYYALFHNYDGGQEAPSVITELTRHLLRKFWVTEGRDLDLMVAKTLGFFERISEFVHHHPIVMLPEFQSLMHHQARLLAEQGDMIWRCLPEQDLIGMDPFEGFEALRKKIIEESRRYDRPLYYKKQILDKMGLIYQAEHSGYKLSPAVLQLWLERLFRQVWYTDPPPNLIHQSSTRLFLEWHLAEALRPGTPVSLNDLAIHLRSQVLRFLPHCPVTDIEIEQVIKRAVNEKKKV